MRLNAFPILLFVSLAGASCSDVGTERNARLPEVSVEGTVRFYIDTLVWIGGECDPSGFILANYNWLKGEPAYPHTRIYLKDSTLALYQSKRVQIVGRLDTVYAGGVETPLRRFPLVVPKQVHTIE